MEQRRRREKNENFEVFSDQIFEMPSSVSSRVFWKGRIHGTILPMNDGIDWKFNSCTLLGFPLFFARAQCTPQNEK
jgi:hypothetical protein